MNKPLTTADVNMRQLFFFLLNLYIKHVIYVQHITENEHNNTTSTVCTVYYVW